MKLLRLALCLTALTMILVRPAAAHHTPTHMTCAPIQYCLFAGCWYELLNNDDFVGTPATCTNWTPSPSVVTTTSACYGETSARFVTGTTTLKQTISVPSTVGGQLQIGIEFATLGTPTSSDRLRLEIWKSGVLQERLTIPADLESTFCHRKDLAYVSNYAGQTVEFRLVGQIATPGVEFHVNWVQFFANLQ